MQLKDGDKVDFINMIGGETWDLEDRGMISMTVEMQLGQMSLVPWVKVQYQNGYTLVNLAHAEDVHISHHDNPVYPEQEPPTTGKH